MCATAIRLRCVCNVRHVSLRCPTQPTLYLPQRRALLQTVIDAGHTSTTDASSSKEPKKGKRSAGSMGAASEGARVNVMKFFRGE